MEKRNLKEKSTKKNVRLTWKSKKTSSGFLWNSRVRIEIPNGIRNLNWNQKTSLELTESF